MTDGESAGEGDSVPVAARLGEARLGLLLMRIGGGEIVVCVVCEACGARYARGGTAASSTA